MNKSLSWRNYIDDNGDFELPQYLYRTNTALMKETLDMGTLLSQDPKKLRAFKEQVKNMFKNRWLQIAEALEFFELVIPCGCNNGEYCEDCSGSRYNLNAAVNPDRMREIGFAVDVHSDLETAEKLYKGLLKALREVGDLEDHEYIEPFNRKDLY